MPAPALKSLAKQAGKSLKDAERYYDDAKKQRIKKVGKKLTSDDYRYIMGIVKKRLGLETKSVEALVQLATSGVEYRHVVEMATGGNINVRTFFDSGFLRFATLDDVMIEAGVDSRIDTILAIVNDFDWPSTHPLLDQLESYEGSLDNLYRNVMHAAKLVGD